MSAPNEPQVVQLVDAGVPADQGLSSLGLLMQLGGSVLAAYASLVAFTMLLALRMAGAGGELIWMFLVLGLSIARSLLHRAAGTQLLYGNGSLTETGTPERMAGMRRYVMFALAQSAAVGGLLAWRFHVPGKLALGLTLALALWPATLAVLMQLPRFKRFRADLPVTEDKGFEGASILMTVLGACGTVATGTVLLAFVDAGNALLRGPGVLLALAVVMLCIRSLFHVQAGISGLRETSVDRSVELANRYANFGVITAFCAGGALLMFIMTSAASVLGIALISGVVWMLMTWPLSIRRFFSERQFADLMAGDDAPIHRRAPDAGLTSLGWLLFAHAMFSATFVIIGLFAGDDSSDALLSSMTALGGANAVRSQWFSIGLVVFQAWAGYELIRMSPQARIIATLFGVVGTAVTVYVNWPIFKLLMHGAGMFSDTSQGLALGVLAIALIIPVATVVLVNRKIAPTARARFRTKPAPPAGA